MPNDPDLAEFIAIKDLTTTAPADQPATVTLEYAVIFPHRRGAIVRQVNPQPQGASQTVAVEAWAGDACVFLDALGALAGAHEIEITGGPGPDEYHKATTFSVTQRRRRILPPAAAQSRGATRDSRGESYWRTDIPGDDDFPARLSAAG